MDFSSGHARVMISALRPKAMGSSSELLIFPLREVIFLSIFFLSSSKLISGDAGIIFIFTATMPMFIFGEHGL